jgi:hypothetical protein
MTEGQGAWLAGMRFMRLVEFMLAVARGAVPACHPGAGLVAGRERQDADECVCATAV